MGRYQLWRFLNASDPQDGEWPNQPSEDRVLGRRSPIGRRLRDGIASMESCLPSVRARLGFSKWCNRLSVLRERDSEATPEIRWQRGKVAGSRTARKPRLAHVQAHVSFLAGFDWDFGWRSTKADATRQRVNHDGLLRQCADGKQTRSKQQSCSDGTQARRMISAIIETKGKELSGNSPSSTLLNPRVGFCGIGSL